MSRIVGIEIGATHLRAVRRGRGSDVQSFSVPFAPATIADAMRALQALVGDAGAISIAMGLAHLHVKQVALPPVNHTARRQMLSVEPERFFAVPAGVPTAVALDGTGAIALGADGAFVEACVAACASWAPVQRVEAAPMALVRAVASAGQVTGAATLDAGEGEVGLVQVRGGVLASVRRVRAQDLVASRAEALAVGGVEPAYQVAYGTTLHVDEALESMLLTPALERTFVQAQRRRLLGWSAAALAAACTAIWALGVSRERTLEALEARVAIARDSAAAGTASVQRALTIDRELDDIAATTASRADALGALAALGVRLPDAAVAQRVRMVGGEWQVEGNAATASAVLASLAAEPHFSNVRFLAPSNRFRDGTDYRETFAIAFAVR